MSQESVLEILIDYNRESGVGELSVNSIDPQGVAWQRIRQAVAQITDEYRFSPTAVSMPWPRVLDIIKMFESYQRAWGFRFRPTSSSKEVIRQFIQRNNEVQRITDEGLSLTSADSIASNLVAFGFSPGYLRNFQLRDLASLLSMPNGANFSVPGAGKTTVTFALHLLSRQPDWKLLVVSPKNAFGAWNDVVSECIPDESRPEAEEFCQLVGGAGAVGSLLNSGSGNRFLISYDQLITAYEPIRRFLLKHPVHLVLDESHRMKGGMAVRRGSALLSLSTLPVRRDILSGTPMPNAPSDIQSQIDFLWPGTGLGSRISAGAAPRDVIANLFVRTTKTDLNLPPIERHYRSFDMNKGQMALYGILRKEALKQLSSFRDGGGADIIRARKSVIRLLQLSVNPVLAYEAIFRDAPGLVSGIGQQILDEGPSQKMLGARDFSRELAGKGRKVVIWTIFRNTIEQLGLMLADLNPVIIDGTVPVGSVEDANTREGRLKIFKGDPDCMLLIANPAAAGEGISLHHVCHDAIYLDRSYNSTHYLQSIDRIHRLGLAKDIVTNVYFFRTKSPAQLGSIDYSVSRRLEFKIRELSNLLSDVDLHQLALDEEEAEVPLDESITQADISDLIAELEGRHSSEDD